jgi:glycosyltransferase involved in cell wall biosynthesis
MRIGIDARLYGVSDRGIGRYTEKLIEYLEKIDFENEYFIFLRQEGFNQYQPKNKNFHKILANYRAYSFKEQIIFPFHLYKYKLDLVHFTHFNVPIFYLKPFIVTIHDLIISKFPDSRATTLPYFLYKIKLIGYKIVLKNAVKFAKKIIAVSEATKKDIVKILKIEPEKIAVIYEGVDLLKTFNSQCPISKKIENPYILYVGAAYPHKNLERLIEAFKKLNQPSLKLVLVGRKDFFYQRLKEYVKKIGLEDKIIFPGQVSDEELASFYKNALFFVFPSLSEGFGLPAIEAMAYNLPIAASDIPSLKEILDDSAIYFDPRSVDEIKKVLEKMVFDKNLREKLREKGKKRIKNFSWQKMANKTLEIYKNYVAKK